MTIYETASPTETEVLGEKIGQALGSGDVIAFSGDLGAGKTALTRGIARGLTIEEAITSPTYTIVNEYEGRLPLFHFDLYRLSGEEELFDLGFEEYFGRSGVCVLEWSQRAGEDVLKELCVGRLFFVEMKGCESDCETKRQIFIRSDGEELKLN